MIYSISIRGKDVTHVAFAPDGRTLAVLSSRSKVTLVDPETGQNQGTRRPLTDYVTCIAFSPDSRLLAVGGGDDIEVWDIDAGARVHELDGPTGVYRSVAFAPDGRAVAAGGRSGIVDLWYLDAGSAGGR